MYSTAFNYTISKDDVDVFDISFRQISRPLKTWKEETIETAKYIASNTTKKIWVGFSGGIDSEVVCRAFLAAGIDFGVFIVQHDNDNNKHDIKFALDFCKANNITDIHISHLDSDWFFTESYKKYVEQGYGTGTIFRYHQLFIMDEIKNLNGCGVLGGGELKFRSVKNKSSLIFDRGLTNASEFCRNNGCWHIPHFFMCTPEIIAAYLEHELIRYLTSDHSFYKSKVIGFIAEKTLVYHQAWPDMLRRRKYDGFEKIRELYNQATDSISKNYPYENKKVVIDINTLRTQLGLPVL